MSEISYQELITYREDLQNDSDYEKLFGPKIQRSASCNSFQEVGIFDKGGSIDEDFSEKGRKNNKKIYQTLNQAGDSQIEASKPLEKPSPPKFPNDQQVLQNVLDPLMSFGVQSDREERSNHDECNSVSQLSSDSSSVSARHKKTKKIEKQKKSLKKNGNQMFDQASDAKTRAKKKVFDLIANKVLPKVISQNLLLDQKQRNEFYSHCFDEKIDKEQRYSDIFLFQTLANFFRFGKDGEKYLLAKVEAQIQHHMQDYRDSSQYHKAVWNGLKANLQLVRNISKLVDSQQDRNERIFDLICEFKRSRMIHHIQIKKSRMSRHLHASSQTDPFLNGKHYLNENLKMIHLPFEIIIYSIISIDLLSLLNL